MYLQHFHKVTWQLKCIFHVSLIASFTNVVCVVIFELNTLCSN